MRIGVHMRRIGKDLEETARLSAEIGCETIQIFASNPNAWHSGKIDPGEAERFRLVVEENNIQPVVIHTPYLLNLASPDPEIYAKSTSALADAVNRADLLGAQFIVTHIGSHRGSGMAQGIDRICKAVSTTLDKSGAPVTILLENSVGAGDTVGAVSEELRTIMDGLEGCSDRLGICLDTAHLWGAGYDISNLDAVTRTVEEFDRIVGLRRLGLLHLNDTNVALGSHRDRHANIDTGNIGEKGFEALVQHPALQSLAGIAETPARTIDDHVRDIGILKRLRGD